jgi:hypothetical protein
MFRVLLGANKSQYKFTSTPSCHEPLKIDHFFYMLGVAITAQCACKRIGTKKIDVLRCLDAQISTKKVQREVEMCEICR